MGRRSKAIRNKDGIWINSELFRTEAAHFQKYGFYVADPEGSPAWFEYWEEQRNRCLNGYSVGGAKIPGELYGYLNFAPIKRSGEARFGIAKKKADFPDFWDGDYNYFWAREIARNGVLGIASDLTDKQKVKIYNLDPVEREKKLVAILDKLDLMFKIVPSVTHKNLRIDNLLGGKDLVLLKSRRKGFSFKNAYVGANNLIHRPDTYTMYMAFDKKYLFPKGIFSMMMDYVNFINKHTAWRIPSDYVRKQDHIRNSYKTYSQGVEIETGYMSEVQAITFGDNPQAGIGKDAYDIIGEEVGSWGTPGGLKEAYSSMLPSVTDGINRTGMMTFFGTANEVGKGTVDFAHMFENPGAYSFLPFYDIWGEQAEKEEGFFFPVQLNMVGNYDDNGNSDFEAGLKSEDIAREKLKIGGATSQQITQRMREFPINSSEALSLISVNTFPTPELKKQLDKIKATGIDKVKGTSVNFRRESGKVIATPILDGSVEPITSLRDLPFDLRGCPVIYEFPIDEPPRGLYKIGYDPVRQDSGTSLAAIIVYKSTYKGSFYHDNIVAEYVGRLETTEDIDKMAEFLADYYNTSIMFENEVPGVKNYFRRIKRLHLLALQPDAVISKNIKRSKVARVFGCHMNDQLKDAGERYVKDWLLEVQDFDENGNPITTIDRIYSRRLLEELIAYDRKFGNFDLVSSLFMCMFQVQEEELGKEYGDDKTDIQDEIMNILG